MPRGDKSLYSASQKRKGISGRWRMRKDELIEALR